MNLSIFFEKNIPELL